MMGTAAQNALSATIRRMRSMAQFNGDIEDSLAGHHWTQASVVL
jgi:hypothetical protein